MDSSPRPVDRLLCLVVTAFGWALNWPLMKLLLQQWPPLFARGLAGVLAAVILASLALSRGQSLSVPREAIPRLMFASFTNVFAWMGFGTMAMNYVTVGEGALIAYTMPIWAMLFAWPFLHAPQPARARAGARHRRRRCCSAPTVCSHGGQAHRHRAGAGLRHPVRARQLNRAQLPMPPLVVVAWQVGLGCFVMLILGIARACNVRHHAARGRLLRLHDTGADGLCYLAVRDAAPPAADLGLDRHAAGARDRRRPTAFILGEPLGLREIAAMVLTLGVTLALQRARIAG
jgi:hypothetical protein